MKRYIITGAPGAGKTAIIRQLEADGFSIVEEAATDVIALWQANGIQEPWTQADFIDAVVRLQQARQHRSADPVQFHDRSVVCTAALAEYLAVPFPPSLLEALERARIEAVFQPIVFFVRNLGFITPSEARRITYEDAVRFEQIHERVYRDHGFEVISIGAGAVRERVLAIQRALPSSHSSSDVLSRERPDSQG